MEKYYSNRKYDDFFQLVVDIMLEDLQNKVFELSLLFVLFFGLFI